MLRVMGVREALSRVLMLSAAADKVIVFVVLAVEMVEVVVTLLEAAAAAAAALGGRPRGDLVAAFCSLVSFFEASAFLEGLLGGLVSFLLADLGRPRGLACFVSGDACCGSSLIGDGLRLRPGDFLVPRLVATSWLDARVVRLVSIR